MAVLKMAWLIQNSAKIFTFKDGGENSKWPEYFQNGKSKMAEKNSIIKMA